MTLSTPAASGAVQSAWSAVVTLALSAVLAVGLPGVAHAHGADVGYQEVADAIQVTAAFDTGAPMSGAQVVVYPPGSSEEPWTTGTTDRRGRFLFMPGSAGTGSWTIEVSQAGHGATLDIPVADLAAEPVAPDPVEPTGAQPQATADDLGFSPLQIGLMAALGIWGAVGTALYFSRKKAT